MSDNPFVPFFNRGTIVLDGGLATELEAKGCRLDDELWSARTLLDSPELIRQVHSEFLGAGADCIATVTYQATLAGFRKSGLSHATSIELMQSAVRLTCEARDTFWQDRSNRTGRLRPLVAASIGPYGAFLADGSEYSGHYDLDADALYAFHQPRWKLLAASPADLMACETIPSLVEAGALLRLLDETPERWGWLSFSCRDQERLSDGSRLADAIRLCAEHANVAAVGINCTAPALIAPLLRVAARHATQPILVYPNSGEHYDARSKTWNAVGPATDWVAAAAEWIDLGAAGVGGCCRTRTDDIRRLHRLVESRTLHGDQHAE